MIKTDLIGKEVLASGEKGIVRAVSLNKYDSLKFLVENEDGSLNQFSYNDITVTCDNWKDKKTGFIIIESDEKETINHKVSELRKEGWELHGVLKVTRMEGFLFNYTQAMVEV